MTSFSFTNGMQSTTAQTLKEGNAGADDTGYIDGTSSLKTAAKAVTIDTSVKASAGGVVLTNYGTILSTGGRAIDDTAMVAGSKITLNNYGTISTAVAAPSSNDKVDVFRIDSDLGVGSSVTVLNAGTMSTNGGSNDSQVLRFGKAYTGTISITNTATGIIRTANADAIRAGNNSTITNAGTITAAASDLPASNLYAAKNGIDISVGQSSTVINSGTITGEGSALGSDVGYNGSKTVTTDTPANYTVTNNAGGSLIGNNSAAIASSGTATITNNANAVIKGLGAGTYNGGTTPLPSNKLNYDGDGINVTLTASITNSGTIQGLRSAGFNNGGRANYSEGIVIGGGTIVNNGTIEGGDFGVTVNNTANADQTRSGSAALNLTNNVGGVIRGNNGYAIRSENKTANGVASAALTDDIVTNYGTIIGNGTVPSGTVLLSDGKTADTNTVGTLNGTTYTSAGNAGSARFILGDGAAIQLGEGNDTLTNYGTITGNSGRAISLEGGDDTLNLYSGGTVTGSIDGGSGTDTLNLYATSGQTSGSLSNVVNFEILNVKSGSWVVNDAESYSNGISISSGAGLTLASSGSTSGSIVDNGTLTVLPTSTLSISDAISGTGSLTQAGSGVLTLSGANSFSGGINLNSGTLDVVSASGAGTGAIVFAAGAQTLRIEQTALTASGDSDSFANTLRNVGADDSIDLRGIGAATSAAFDNTTNRLTIAGGSQTVILQLDGNGAPAAGYAYGVTSDGVGGTLVGIDKIATVQTLSATPATGYVRAGQSFTLTIALDKPVTVSGAGPTLTLSDGGTATFNAGKSSGQNLVFDVPVTSGQNSQGVSITAISGAGTVQDAAHVTVDLGGAINQSAVGPTIDTIAPTVTITSMGGLTNSPDQTISGTVGVSDAGTTVYIFDGQTQLGTAVVQNDGTWSTTITLSGNGDHTISAQDTDAAGNTGSSNNVVYTLSTTAPPVAFTSTSTLTNQATVTVAGTVDISADPEAVGTTVSIKEGNVVLATAIVGNDGSWTAQVTLSGEGQHVLRASDTDAAGNTGTSNPITITLDQTAPAVAITSQGGLTNQTTQVVSGSVGAEDAGTTITLLEGDNVLGTATVGSDGKWSTSIALTGEGQHTITAQDTDAAGNTGTSNAITFNLDTTAPTVAISSVGGLTNQASQIVSGTVDVADAGTVVSIKDGNVVVGTATVQSDGKWSTGVILNGDGQHILTASDTDAAGNTGFSSSVTYTLDTTPPAVSINSNGGLTKNPNQTISGSVGVEDAGTTITIRDGGTVVGTATVGSDGKWSTGVTFTGEGQHVLTASDRDAAGNVGTSNQVTYTLDTKAPTIDFTSEDQTIYSRVATLSGTVDVSANPSDIHSTITIYEGNTALGTAKVSSNGMWSTSVILSGDGDHTLVAKDTDAAGNVGQSEAITVTVDTSTPQFQKGNLVVSVYGNGDNSGDYDDNAGTPIVLKQFTTTGTFVNQLVLPQSSYTLNGKTNSVISGEYGSSSEGSIQLTGNGRALLIAGYGVNANDYNDGGAAVYGDDALAQTRSLTSQTQFTPVSRVIAVIDSSGSVDTTTSLFNIYNGNNPRSVASVDGNSFYISGQGFKGGDNTQGVYLVQRGASTATLIDGTTDTRTAVIYDGQLFISRDSKQPKGGAQPGSSNIGTFGGLPTSLSTSMVLQGINRSVTLTAGQTNSINSAGQTVNLDPENFFFANRNTLYVADGGIPKQGGIGDGGLQKWVFDGSRWQLQYTLSNGLNIIAPGATYGTTGLIGLTGRVVGNTVELYTTNITVGDIDQTYLYGITDQLSATSSQGQSFTQILKADAGTNIRGVSFAPTTEAPTVEITSEGGITNSPSQLISGTVDLADAGTTVQIKEGNTVLGSAVVGIEGNWSTTITLTGEGKHTIVASDTDGYGNTGVSNKVSFTLDVTPPSVAITSAGSLTNRKTQLVSGTGEAGTTVTLYDGNTELGSARVRGDGTWSRNVTLDGEGDHTIVAKDVDAAGNVGTSAPVTYTLDTTPPGAVGVALVNDTGSSSTDGITSDPRLNFTAPEAGVTLLYRVDNPTDFTSTPPVFATDGSQDGRHTIVVKAQDAAGNIGPATSFSFVLDTRPPGAAGVALVNDSGSSTTDRITNDPRIAYTSPEAGATLLYKVDGAADYTTDKPVFAKDGSADGKHTVSVRARDAAGNLGAATTLTFTLDTQAPAAPGIALVNDSGSSNTDRITNDPRITYTSPEAGATLLYKVDGATDYTTDKPVFAKDGTADGKHTVSVRARDAAGNLGAVSTLTFTLDTRPPAAPGVALVNDTGSSNTDRITNDPRINFASPESGATLLYKVDGAADYTTTQPVFAKDGSADGKHTISVRARDVAGNLGAASSLNFTLDTVAPNVSITSQGGAVSKGTQTISGTGEAGTLVTLMDGNTSLGTAGVAADGTWRRNVTLAGNGRHDIVASDVDRAGNVGVSNTVSYTLNGAAANSSMSRMVQAMAAMGASSSSTSTFAAPQGGGQEHQLAIAH